MADLEGMDRLLEALRDRIEAARDGTADGLLRAAHRIEAGIKLKLSITSHSRGTRTPSAPGSPPSLVSGALRRSVMVGDIDRQGDTHSVKVYPSMIYSRIQELGGIAGRGARLPARPYVGPAVDESIDDVARIFRDAWEQALD